MTADNSYNDIDANIYVIWPQLIHSVASNDMLISLNYFVKIYDMLYPSSKLTNQLNDNADEISRYDASGRTTLDIVVSDKSPIKLSLSETVATNNPKINIIYDQLLIPYPRVLE